MNRVITTHVSELNPYWHLKGRTIAHSTYKNFSKAYEYNIKKLFYSKKIQRYPGVERQLLEVKDDPQMS